MRIVADNLDSMKLNQRIRKASGSVLIDRCFGQRYIGSGSKDKKITIYGTPGNALGSYLDGATITVHGNGQDMIGDTMNSGEIVIHGNAGDGLGYAMRGGMIFVRGSAGCRAGIHMKQYQDQKPALVIGGKAGSFLGEYMAGGMIIVLGLGIEDAPVGDFTGTGMHGGCIYIRTNRELAGLPAQVHSEIAAWEDKQEILPLLLRFGAHFGCDGRALADDRYYLLKPNTARPYAQLYTKN
ncbi:MAG TPA: glutamate synthase [Limnochordia bacterium]|jgi:glutamate synthase domain-containing protein 3|nr:glutamate synthase [Bacillota bacterium]HOB08745.1 glutamate synthase [Limnochordia bacterium]HQD71283.1 glutamate synthase [Limnochordia bacterium]HXK96596.1 glutamate synthase [Limnochordia bacterium]